KAGRGGTRQSGCFTLVPTAENERISSANAGSSSRAAAVGLIRLFGNHHNLEALPAMRLFRSDTTEPETRSGGSERPPVSRRPAALATRVTIAASATGAVLAAAVAAAQLNPTLQ